MEDCSETNGVNSLLMYYATGQEYDHFDQFKQFVIDNPHMRNEMPTLASIIFVRSTSLNVDKPIFKDLTNACEELRLPINYRDWLDDNHAKLLNAICG
jgi:hypothetical protein